MTLENFSDYFEPYMYHTPENHRKVSG